MTNDNSAQTNQSIDISEEAKTNIYTERYKYIIEKIKFLDTLMHKNLSLYFQFTLAICAGLSASIVMRIEDKASFETVKFILEFLFLLQAVASLFIIIMTVAIVRSWFNYRDDEIDFLNKIKCDLNREKPNLEGLFRWSETYLVIISIVIGLASLLGFSCADILIANVSN